jgi:hypothetical protein
MLHDKSISHLCDNSYYSIVPCFYAAEKAHSIGLLRGYLFYGLKFASLLYLLTYIPKKAKLLLNFAFEMRTQQGAELVFDYVVESTIDGGCNGRISAELN